MPEKYNDDLGEWDEMNDEIKILSTKLHHLIDNCLNNMGIEEMEEISKRMGSIVEQGMFWLKEGNTSRFAYDLQDFLNWLTDFIADKDREFWGQ
jgi:hypothetical protein